MSNATIAKAANEPAKAYGLFCEYVRMGDERSLAALYQVRIESGSKIALSTLRGYSVRYRWQERLVEYETAAQAAITARWQRRQEAIRESDFALADKLRELATKILESGPKFIKASRSVETLSDGTVREVHTIALNGELMIKAMETASKLQRQASGLDRPGHVDIKSNGQELTALTLPGLSDEDRRAIIRLAYDQLGAGDVK